MDFLEILRENNEGKIKEYLLQYGKSPKPRAPFYFILDKEEPKDAGNTVYEGSNETDPGDYCETEITE